MTAVGLLSSRSILLIIARETPEAAERSARDHPRLFRSARRRWPTTAALSTIVDMNPLYDPAVVVRRAEPGDVHAIRAIQNDAIMNSTAVWTGQTRSAAATREWLDEHIRRDAIHVAEVGATLAGYASWSPWREKEGYRFTVEDSVYLLPDHQGRGLGRRLLSAAIESARASGAHLMVAHIEASNVASIRLHERLGFEVVGTLREVGTKFDRWLDLTIMRLEL